MITNPRESDPLVATEIKEEDDSLIGYLSIVPSIVLYSISMAMLFGPYQQTLLSTVCSDKHSSYSECATDIEVQRMTTFYSTVNTYATNIACLLTTSTLINHSHKHPKRILALSITGSFILLIAFFFPKIQVIIAASALHGLMGQFTIGTLTLIL